MFIIVGEMGEGAVLCRECFNEFLNITTEAGLEISFYCTFIEGGHCDTCGKGSQDRRDRNVMGVSLNLN
ncbi:MAG: hypothetical protein K8T10_20000 [Candidatus Eremiobacteraeota bacterium]|nr:hypothetical protein [Candidatus Eremiobacteraeota bacterium]